LSARPGARQERQAEQRLGWYLLIHQLPPRPLYLRAKIRNRLARVGALALKNSVYVLPCRDECLEDLQWIAQEALAGGGDAFVCSGRFMAGVSDEALVRAFRKAADAAYARLRGEAGRAHDRVRAAPAPGEEARTALLRLRRRLDEVAGVDFFGAEGRKEVEAMVRALEARLRGRAGADAGGRRRPQQDLVGRVWVTRKDPKIDRLASAWLIRRFVDPGARFRFIEATKQAPRDDEIGFDMAGARFSHEGERCTFETLVARLGIQDAGVRAIGEVVHDLDLKDGRYARPEAEGVRQLLQGLLRAHPDDAERLERGLSFFDDLHASYRDPASGGPRAGPRPASPADRPSGKRPRRSSVSRG
jgi:hypothetical protein